MDNVKLFRLDYRLLHWQTGVLWVQKLNASLILVSGDIIAEDDMRKNLIKLAAPKNLKVLILNNKEAIEFLNSDDSQKYTIELLVERTEDALELIKGVPGLKKLNAALMKTAPGKKMISKYLAVNEEDIENFRKILDLGVEVGCYTVPTEKNVDIRKYIK
ncbi:MAG: PTS sugar transporter subunit IIB [Bacilli bacterium]